VVGYERGDVRLVIDHENAMRHDGLFCGSSSALMSIRLASNE
jgi:hypothetical protein